jgi:hypothetical protein
MTATDISKEEERKEEDEGVRQLLILLQGDPDLGSSEMRL